MRKYYAIEIEGNTRMVVATGVAAATSLALQKWRDRTDGDLQYADGELSIKISRIQMKEAIRWEKESPERRIISKRR